MRVLNKRKYKEGLPENSVYIGRPSKWGNPFIIGIDGSRKEVLEKYKTWITLGTHNLYNELQELEGKNLVCWCAPKPCHGDVLLELLSKKDKI